MRKSSGNSILVIGLLALLAWYLFFFQSGRMALTDPDEVFYAETAKEMLSRNEWITPYLYGKPQFEKPILFYWLIEASFKVFGVNEFAARFPSGLFGLLGIIGVYLLGRLLFNERVAKVSSIILAASVEYVILSRACVTDMVLATFMLWGALFFFYGLIRGESYFYILSGAAFAFATLTKGPIAIMLAGSAIIIYLFLAGEWKNVKWRAIFLAIAAFAAISLPWYLSIYKLHGKEFMDVFFGFHNVTRFLESEHKIGSQFYYNIPILFGGFFPWSVFLPLALWHIFKKAQYAIHNTQYENWHSLFIIIWFLVIFVFFSVSSTKLPTYIFPCFFSAALMVAVLLDDFLKKQTPDGIAGAVKLFYYLLLGAVVIGIIGALIFVKIDYPIILKGVLLSCLVLIIGFGISLFMFLAKRYIVTFAAIVCTMAVFLYPLNEFVIQEIERFEASKEISQQLLSRMKEGEMLGAESNYLPGLAFYSGKMPINLDKHNTLIKFLYSKQRVWCVLKEKNYRHIYELDTKPRFVGVTYMVYRFGKKVIFTNKLPDDGKYILRRERDSK